MGNDIVASEHPCVPPGDPMETLGVFPTYTLYSLVTVQLFAVAEKVNT